MAYKYGELYPNDNAEYPYKGHIRTRALDINFGLKRLEKRSDNAPDFEIHDRGKLPVGKVWMKEIKRGEDAGKIFFSMTFDGPDMPQALNVTAFPTNNENVYDITWERPKQSAASKAA